MKTRKAFLTAAAAGAAFATPAAVFGGSALPSPSPIASPTPPPSAEAHAFALRMRRFDAQLTDAQIDDIAQGIDQLYDLGKTLRTKKHPLNNGDAPTPQFRVNP